MKQEEQNRDFKGIWIPKEVWLSDDLTMQEKLFFVEIDSLDNEDGCFATNEYFAKFFGISKTRVSKVINSLVKKGYIISKLTYKEGTKQIDKRVLNKSSRGYETKVQGPIEQKFKDNNTVNNTINNKDNKGASNEAPSKSSSKFLKSEILKNELELKFPSLSILEEIEKMTDWLKANGKRKKDYAAFARTWCRNAEKYQKENNKRNGNNKGNYDHDEQLRIAREAAEQSLVERRQRAAMFAD
jgi:hypothetical protein